MPEPLIAPALAAPDTTTASAATGNFGLIYMVLSCCFFCGMGTFVMAGQQAEPEASFLVSSFARIAVNLLVMVGIAGARGAWQDLFGDRRFSLWMRGIFGAFSLLSGFAAIQAIGIGESTFLSSSSGIFIALLAPFVLKQKNTPKVWVAILGSIAGLYLLVEPRFQDDLPYGRLLALASGFFGACAYMMIARAGRSNSSTSVVFYFCIVATALHLVLFATVDAVWPQEPATYALLVTAGVFGSLGQIFLTLAYQNAPAALNGAVAYLQPVLNTVVSVVVFGRHPDAKAWLGSLVVLVFGVALPFARIGGLSRSLGGGSSARSQK